MKWCYYFCAIIFGANSSAEKVDDQGWALAVPGYQITFPQDHGPHFQFRTEWWYFTGNLKSNDGREFGYQLTFFRNGCRSPKNREPTTSRFIINDIKFAHFAITDVGAHIFHCDSRTSRGAYGEAGFGEDSKLAWIEDWAILFDGNFRLRATSKDYAISLGLIPEKQAVLQGNDGLVQASEGEGRASYYYSISRLKTSGTVRIDDQSYEVEGGSWFDRQWASTQLAHNQVGWDWFAIQLSDGSDLMVYHMRLKDGRIDPYSNGKFIRPDLSIENLDADDFQLIPRKNWESSFSNAKYPVEWELRIPKLSINLKITTPVENQELKLAEFFKVAESYWEGCIQLKGERKSKPVDGLGYMELTGYANSR